MPFICFRPARGARETTSRARDFATVRIILHRDEIRSSWRLENAVVRPSFDVVGRYRHSCTPSGSG
jgi:hypothetical protein